MPIPNWLVIVIVIVLVLAVGMLLERWRGSGVEKWAKANGFRVLSPFVPTETVPAAALALRFAPRGARIWGAGVEGICDGVPVVIAEHEVDGGSRNPDVWFTLIMWPAGSTAGSQAARDWTGDGQIAIDQGYAAWRMKGLITPDRLDSAIAQLPAVRRSLE